MKRLGYPRFASQGGDWGGAVTNAMGQQAPPESQRRSARASGRCASSRGGHFAAWEEPELFATEIRATFTSLR
jgi:hypothetical protein